VLRPESPAADPHTKPWAARCTDPHETKKQKTKKRRAEVGAGTRLIKSARGNKGQRVSRKNPSVDSINSKEKNQTKTYYWGKRIEANNLFGVEVLRFKSLKKKGRESDIGGPTEGVPQPKGAPDGWVFFVEVKR